MENQEKGKPRVSVEFYNEQAARMACALVRETLKEIRETGICCGCSFGNIEHVEMGVRTDLISGTFFADMYL
jgi:hypothetical protein